MNILSPESLSAIETTERAKQFYGRLTLGCVAAAVGSFAEINPQDAIGPAIVSVGLGCLSHIEWLMLRDQNAKAIEKVKIGFMRARQYMDESL